MALLNDNKRRAVVPLAAIGLAAYYAFVFLPLGHRSEDLDGPLQSDWKTLAASVGQSNALVLDFRQITNQLSTTRHSLEVVDNTRKQATARLELTAALRARVTAPFQVVEFDNERSKLTEELDNLAKQQGVTLEPSVLGGLPEVSANDAQPGLLWAGLAMTDGLLQTALRCKVTAIHSLDVSPAPSADASDHSTRDTTTTPANAPAGSSAEPPPLSGLYQIPVQLEFTGPAASVFTLLQSLPLRAEEIRAAGLPPGSAERPPLFIDRLVIKKQSPEKNDEVRVLLRVVGFVFL